MTEITLNLSKWRTSFYLSVLATIFLNFYAFSNSAANFNTFFGKTVTFKASNNLYLSSENGVKPVSITRKQVGSWEKFTVIHVGNGRVALKGSNGKFISSEKGFKSVTCNRNKVGVWEKFTFVNAGNGFVALRASNGRFLSLKNSGNFAQCNKQRIGRWEKFIVKPTFFLNPGKISKTQVKCGAFQPEKLQGTKAVSNDPRPLLYQWQIKTQKNTPWKNIKGANKIHYTPKYANVGSRWYRRGVSRKFSNKFVYSNTVDIHAKPCGITVTPGEISKTQIKCGAFQPEKLTGTAAKTSDQRPVVYQWQIKIQKGAEWQNINGANQIYYTPAFASSGSKWYRRAAKGKNTHKYVYSNVIDIHVRKAPKAEIEVTDIDCNHPTGNIRFNFDDCEGRSHIAFSVDGGANFTRVQDNTGAFVFDSLAAGTYDIVIKWGNNDCPINLGTYTIVDEQISILTSEDQSVCAGTEVTLTATADEGSTFLWSTGATTSSIVVTPEATTTYTVTAQKGNCTVSEEIIVTVNEATVSVSGQEICLGATATLTAVGEGTVLWSTGETTSSIEVSPLVDTTYSVTLTSAEGCTATAEALVVVNEATVSVSGQEICLGATATLTAVGEGTVLWSTGETTTSIEVSPLVDTTYSVTLTSAEGCTATAEALVVVNEATVSVSGQEICLGATATLTAVGEGTVLWSTGETTSSIEVSSLVDTTYSVTLTSAEGCTATAEALVVVNEATVSVSGQEICLGATATLTAVGEGTVSWSTGETTSSIEVSPLVDTTYSVTLTSAEGCTATAEALVVVNEATVSVADKTVCFDERTTTLTAEGEGTVLWSTGETTKTIEVTPDFTTTYSVTLTSPQGCVATDEATVTVESRNPFRGERDLFICLGEEVTLTAEPATSYLWSTGETTQSITVSPTEDAWIVLDALIDGCNGRAVIEILVNEATVSVADKTVCFDERTTTLTAEGEGTVLWSTGETTKTIEVTPDFTTTYSVTLTSPQGCVATDEATVTVESRNPFRGERDLFICLGEEVTLTAEPATSYLWSTGETTQSITVSPTEDAWIVLDALIDGCNGRAVIEILVNEATVSVADKTVCFDERTTTLTAEGEGTVLWSTGETTKTIEVTPDFTTTYSVTLTSPQGCVATDEATVTVESRNPFRGERDLFICLGEEVTLTAEPATSYLWSTGETTQSITVSPTEDAWIVLDALIDGCNGRAVIEILVDTSLNDATISPEITINEGETTQLEVSGGDTYLWADNGSTDAVRNVSPLTTTTYEVTVTKNSCSKVLSVTVNVIPTPVDPCLAEVFNVVAGPNPISPTGTLTIDIAVQEAQEITYAFFDISGNRVGPLVNATVNSGCNQIPVNLLSHCNFNPGSVYILIVTGANGNSENIQIITTN